LTAGIACYLDENVTAGTGGGFVADISARARGVMLRLNGPVLSHAPLVSVEGQRGAKSIASLLEAKLYATWISWDLTMGLIGFVHRLRFLEEDYAEEGIKPNVEGFDGLLAYLSRHTSVRMPSLSITREGAFAAIWDGANNSRVRLDFSNKTEVHWVIVSEDSEERLLGGSGVLSMTGIDGILEAYGATAWTSQ
jgi:hypothetical protein